MQRIQGWSEQGNTKVVVSGLSSTTLVQKSFPGSTITVYLTGTLTLASIYSDDNAIPTPLGNPFTVSATGAFGFFVGNGSYDLVFSGTGIATPFTLSDIQAGVGSSGVPSYAFASLPPSKNQNAGNLARVSDTQGGLWMDSGIQWVKTLPFVNVKDAPFNAKGDGVTDDAAAINAAAVAAGSNSRVIFPAATYLIGSTLTLKNDGQVWDMNGAIIQPNFTGVAIRVGEDGSNHSNIMMIGGRIARASISWTPSNTALQVSRVYNSKFIGQSIYGFEKGIQITTPSSAETDQNEFNFESIYNCKYGIYIYPTTSGACNANVFHGSGQIQYTVGDPAYGSPLNISSSTNASPIAVTTAVAHGLATGATVVIAKHATNTNANGTWIVTVTGATTFTLNGSTGNGVGGATGTADTGSYAIFISKTNDANGNVNSTYCAGIYLATSNSGANPKPNAIFLNGALNTFDGLHTEGFPLPKVILGPDAGGPDAAVVKNPNYFWNLEADWTKASDDLGAVNTALSSLTNAQFAYSGRDGIQLCNGGNSNSDSVLDLIQIGANSKDVLRLLTSGRIVVGEWLANGTLKIIDPANGARFVFEANQNGAASLNVLSSTVYPLVFAVGAANRYQLGTEGLLSLLTSGGSVQFGDGNAFTYSSLTAKYPSPKDGQMAWITDCNNSTFNNTAAGGGSTHTIVVYNSGTGDWRIH